MDPLPYSEVNSEQNSCVEIMSNSRFKLRSTGLGSLAFERNFLRERRRPGGEMIVGPEINGSHLSGRTALGLSVVEQGVCIKLSWRRHKNK